LWCWWLSEIQHHWLMWLWNVEHHWLMWLWNVEQHWLMWLKCGTALAHVTEMWNSTGSCDWNVKHHWLMWLKCGTSLAHVTVKCGTTLAHVTVKCGTALVHVTVKCGTAMKAPFLFFVSKCSVGQSLMFISFLNRIGGVMVSVLASSVVDLGIEPRLSQTKDYQIGFCCISAKHTALRREQRLVGSESG
jgi:hypothetical protein